MMSEQDTRFSRVRWVGNLYQKFEAVCQEVDDIVSHEHIKTLENHVQLVGDNMLKFCSNVKDLIPSSFGVPVKHVDKPVNSIKRNFELEDGEQFPQQIGVIYSSESWPSDIQVSDDLHSEDNVEIPSFIEPSSHSSGLQLLQSDRFVINQDYDSHSVEETQSSEISEVFCPDSYFTDDSFTEEKQSPSDASELHGSYSVIEKSDSFTKKEDQSLSHTSKLSFPGEDPCKIPTSSMLLNQSHQNHESGDNLSVDVSPSACKHSLGSEFLVKEVVLCDSSHEFSLGSQVCSKEDMICDSTHKHGPESEFRVKEDIVHDSVMDTPYSLLASSVTSSYSEASTVRLPSSINAPLLDSSDHCEIKFHCREEYTYNNIVVEIGSTSTSSAASQSLEPSSCILSPNKDLGELDSSLLFPRTRSPLTFTGPIISQNGNGSLKPKQTELRDKLELDGGCIFVEADRNYTASSAVRQSWLRKKKMRDPFSSRKMLEKEYKQLSIWYCDIDTEFDEVPGEKIVPSSHDKHLPPKDLQDSEWELL